MPKRSIAITAGIALLVTLSIVALFTRGCTRRQYVDIGPDQTAFAIPYEGDRGNQNQLFTEDYLRENQISVKRYMIPYVKLRDTNMSIGKWREAVKLIVIDLKPVVRAWTGDTETGTSVANQAIVAETRESIGFAAEMNCSAQVNEENAAKFVHFYYGKSLDDVMDSQVRPYVQQVFTEECAKYTLDNLLLHKADIMKSVRTQTTKFFASRGIDIMSLGMQGELSYLNPSIQDSIDKRIQAKNDYEAQKFQNRKLVETAQARAKEARLLASSKVALRLRQLEIQRIQAENQGKAIEKWDGQLPTYQMGGAVPFISVPSK
ncbi:MAG: hypothetical protein HY876_04110 [Coriobacteriales bacterium]|nr:hypothetical protein [Coriobacteriales bacterium]